MTKEEHWRIWAIDGMPKDKQRLAEATWEAAIETAADLVSEMDNPWAPDDSGGTLHIADAIRGLLRAMQGRVQRVPG